MEHCPNCGTELKETNWGRYFCPNCGIINMDEEKSDKDPDYVG